MPTIDVTYPNLTSLIQPYSGPSRRDSSAFLLWFLQNIYRLEQYDAEDAVCDGSRDKGIDGVYVDHNSERIDVFQCEIGQNPAKTIGDSGLREFSGSLAHFNDADSVRRLARQIINPELASILDSEKIAERISDGYEVRGVFVTNMTPDTNTIEYLQNEHRIHLYDRGEIQASYIPPGEPLVIEDPIHFSTAGLAFSKMQVGGYPTVLASLRAVDLVKMKGIDSGTLFAWNVRQSLGRTKVNRDISESIRNTDKHKHFLLYHNGLTILAKDMRSSSKSLKISGYTVVNACQSLSSLYEHRALLTPDLLVLTKLIRVEPSSLVAQEITHHSNNQNPINARDLQANSSIQRRLQHEMMINFGSAVFYNIKRGEVSSAPRIIDNELSARTMLAFDLKEPWSCHQTYKLFDEKYSEIFGRPEVNAQRIYVLDSIYSVALSRTPLVVYQNMGRYRLTTFFLLYLLRRALEETDDQGSEFCKKPERYLEQSNGLARITRIMDSILGDILVDINEEIRERSEGDTFFDYKSALKSPTSIVELAKGIIPQYQKGAKRGRASSFGSEWNRGI
jgi:hypothetical protein